MHVKPLITKKSFSSDKINSIIENKKIKQIELSNLILPNEPNEPSDNISDYGFLIQGERGIGKTTLSSMFPNVLHFAFEPGVKALKIRSVSIKSWDEALHYRDLILKTPGYCDNIVVDTVYMSYELCYNYKLEKFGINDPKDESWGTAWKFIEKEFRDWYFSFLNAGIGIICIAHTEEKEIKRRVLQANGKYSFESVGCKLKTEIGAQASRLFKAIIDLEGYYYQDWDQNGKRFLRIKESDYVVAKNRIEGHFLYNNKEPMEIIPMGINKKQSYNNLCKAFNNEFKKEELSQVNTIKKSKLKRK